MGGGRRAGEQPCGRDERHPEPRAPAARRAKVDFVFSVPAKLLEPKRPAARRGRVTVATRMELDALTRAMSIRAAQVAADVGNTKNEARRRALEAQVAALNNRIVQIAEQIRKHMLVPVEGDGR